MPLLFALLACDPTAVPRPGESADPPEDAGDAAAEAFFATDRVHTVALELSTEAIETLDVAPKTWVEGAATLDGQRFARVGVRVKGSSTLQTFDGKPSLKLDLNRFVDQDYGGLELVQLHGMIVDSSQLHEAMAWHVAAELGLPHSRVAYVRLTVNGEDYGLYAHVEAHDDVWMDRTFGDDGSGRLYEGGYPYWPESYDHADFVHGEVLNFDLEEGENVAHADLLAVADEVLDLDAPGWYERVDPLLDLQGFARLVAAEAWIGQWDGYAYVANNFRVYVDDGGRAEIVMSGLDWSFTEGADWAHPVTPLARACQADPDCAAELDAAVAAACTDLDAAALIGERERLWALIEDEVTSDPRRPIPLQMVRDEQRWLDQWLRDRSTLLAAAWAGGGPHEERWRHD